MSRKVIILLIVAPIFTILDQLTKILVRSQIPKGDRIDVIPDLFRLIHVENPGAAWGLMGDNEHRLLIFLGVSIVAFVVIGFYFKALPATEGWLSAALAMILSGAVGNFIDRALFHKVTDFADFHIGCTYLPFGDATRRRHRYTMVFDHDVPTPVQKLPEPPKTMLVRLPLIHEQASAVSLWR